MHYPALLNVGPQLTDLGERPLDVFALKGFPFGGKFPEFLGVELEFLKLPFCRVGIDTYEMYLSYT